MGFLASLIPSSWLVYAGIVVVIFGAGSYAGHWAQATLDAPKLATAQEATAKAVAEAQALGAQVAQAEAKNAADVATANAKAADDARAEGTLISQLQSQLTTETLRRASLSSTLSEALSHAPKTDDRPLGPALLRYVDGVRQQQLAPATDGSAPPADH